MKIVHFSDVHFGFIKSTDKEGKLSTESSHWFVDTDTGKPRPSDLADILTREVRCHKPDIIVGSGDFGWSGSAEDYQYTLTFLRDLQKSWEGATFVLNAGNHDVDLDGPLNEERQDYFVAMLQEFYGKEFGSIFPFFEGGPAISRRDRLVSFHYQPNQYLVVSINTASSINALSDPILVRPRVLELVAKKLVELKPSAEVFRIFVLHHHLLPFVEPVWSNTLDIQEVRDRPDSSVVANSARLQTWLAKNRFRLVLHGHKHLFHGREDLLWQEDKELKRDRVLIIGAGSAGVSRKELGRSAHHSFNVINVAPWNDRTWEVSVATASITDEGGYHEASKWSMQRSLLGSEEKSIYEPLAFYAKNTHLCHAAIERAVRDKGQIRNFISIVEDSRYLHPPTVSIGEEPAKEEDVRRSFVALHPEYDEERHWSDTASLDNFLKNLSESYSIQHGPRLFARVKRSDAMEGLSSAEELRPIKHALTAIPTVTRAYVGLYHPEKDVVSRWGPVPGLVGVQFIPNDERGLLDIVFTFRNLELSFWWAVNMLEARRIQEWACRTFTGKAYNPGAVTFFSSVAEWRPDPRPMFVSEIDKTEMDELFVLVMAANAGSDTSIGILAERLEEKMLRTTAINIETRGLDNILILVKGLVRQRATLPSANTREVIDEKLKSYLESAVSYLRQAMDNPRNRGDFVGLARAQMELAVAALRNKVVNPPLLP